MTYQKNASPDQKVSSPMDAERRRRMRETAEAAAREAPGEWRTGERGAAGFWHGFHAVTCDAVGDAAGHVDRAVLLQANSYFPVEPISRHVVETQPSAVLALLDALEQAERERDELKKRLEMVAMRSHRAEDADDRPLQPAPRPLSWADVCDLQERVDELSQRGPGDALAKAAADLAVAKAAWGMSGLDRPKR